MDFGDFTTDFVVGEPVVDQRLRSFKLACRAACVFGASEVCRVVAHLQVGLLHQARQLLWRLVKVASTD